MAVGKPEICLHLESYVLEDAADEVAGLVLLYRYLGKSKDAVTDSGDGGGVAGDG